MNVLGTLRQFNDLKNVRKYSQIKIVSYEERKDGIFSKKYIAYKINYFHEEKQS